MSRPTSRRLLARLYQDLAELRDAPYPGVAVFTDDANLRKLCLVLTPPSGPWRDLQLHFDVVLPEDWPTSPPKVSSSVSDIDHPNLFGRYICCDLLKKEEEMYDEAGYTGGYTPALTLRGLFLQFLTFFSSRRVEQTGGYVRDIGDESFLSYHWDSGHPNKSFTAESGCAHVRQCDCVKGLKPMEELWKSVTTVEKQMAPVSNDLVALSKKYIPSHFPSQSNTMYRVEHRNHRWNSTFKLISKFQCQHCEYGFPTFPHHRQDPPTLIATLPSTLLQPPKICAIEVLSDDCLEELAFHLPSESVISLSLVYPRFRAVITSFHVLLRRELRCFFLRIPMNECVLGIGVSLDKGSRKISSDFDWLSLEAFMDYKVRSSIEKRHFQYFLPLAFNREHFHRAEKEIKQRLYALDLAVCAAEVESNKKSKHPSNRRTGRPAKPFQIVECIYRMMNSIVVSLMEACDGTLSNEGRRRDGAAPPSRSILCASEKAVTSYCALLHLLMALCRTTPDILVDATVKLRNFVNNPAERLKSKTPDLGELIVVITLVLIMPPIDRKNPLTWDFIRGKFLEEAITRNVRWVLKESPELEILEEGPSDYRLEMTFNRSKTSARLIMFQITFLNVFLQTYQNNISKLDDNYGIAESGVSEGMVKEIKAIYAVEGWLGFFERVRFNKQLSKGAFSDMLRQTVRESEKRRYHVKANVAKLGQYARMRKDKEATWWAGRLAGTVKYAPSIPSSDAMDVDR